MARTSPRQPAHHLVLRIRPAEAVGQKRIQRDVFLLDEAGRRQAAVGQHVEHGADAGRGGDLDGAAHLAADALRIDLVGVGFLQQAAVAAAARR